MACFLGHRNRCYKTSPNPIRISGDCAQDRLDIINPQNITSYAFFENTTQNQILNGEVIPTPLKSFRGNKISQDPQGKITLLAGTYETTYFVQAESVTLLSVAISIDGNIDQTTAASTNGNGALAVNKTVVISPSQTATLNLVNLSNSISITNANLTIKEI